MLHLNTPLSCLSSLASVQAGKESKEGPRSPSPAPACLPVGSPLAPAGRGGVENCPLCDPEQCSEGLERVSLLWVACFRLVPETAGCVREVTFH